MNTNLILTSFATSLLVLSIWTTGRADVILLNVATDGYIDSGGNVDDAGNFVFARMGGGGTDDRGVFEFDLGAIPDGALIHSVQFSGLTRSIISTTNDAEVDLYGYVGTSPAQITSADYTGGSLIGELDQAAEQLVSDTEFRLTLDDLTAFHSALDSSGVFGIRAHMTTNNDVWRVDSSEFNTTIPALTVNFTAIPEPSSASLGLLVLMGVAAIGRRRRGENINGHQQDVCDCKATAAR